MSRENLIAQLERCSKQADEDIKANQNDNRADWAHIREETIQPFAEQLRSNHEISQLQDQVYLLPNESSVIDLSSVAVYLIDRARRVPAQEIVDSLLRIVSERTVQRMEVRLVEGLSVDRPMQLSDEFYILPIGALSEEGHPRELFSAHNVPRHGWGAVPESAVVRRRVIALQLAPRPVGDEPFPEFNEPPCEEAWNAALQAIVLSTDGAPQYRQGYQVATDAGWLGMANNGWGASESFPVPVKHATAITTPAISEIFDLLARPRSKSIDLAIRRLESARRRINIEDTVIDLGLCAEILLMGGSKDNAEISYKLATRAAWLIDGGADARLGTFSLIRTLYSLRSSVAHTGKLKDLRSMEEEEQRLKVIADSDRLCASLVIAMLSKGEVNDDLWKNIVLNAPVPQ